MLKLCRAVFAVALVSGVSAPSLAQAPSTAAPPTAATSKESHGRLNEIICQKQEVTGSRLITKKVCKTRAQWADQQMQDRQDIEKAQTQRWMKN